MSDHKTQCTYCGSPDDLTIGRDVSMCANCYGDAIVIVGEEDR